MRTQFSDDTCAGRCPWTGSGYLPSPVSSGFLLGVMPDGAAIWASIHCGDQTPRPLTRSGVRRDKVLRLPDVSQDPWRSEVSGPSRHRPRITSGDADTVFRRHLRRQVSMDWKWIPASAGIFGRSSWRHARWREPSGHPFFLQRRKTPRWPLAIGGEARQGAPPS